MPNDLDVDDRAAIDLWPLPDMGVLRHGRREPPPFPIETFGPRWSQWIALTAEGSSAPVDYTACALLAAAATLIGHARWVAPWESWREPPVLWIANVGDPGSAKSPAIDPLVAILKRIEIGIVKDFAPKHHQWLAEQASAKAHRAIWETEVREAAKAGKAPPQMPAAAIEPPEPVRARIVSSDATTEKLAELAAAHGKGVMLLRDELAGWYGSLGRYSRNGADRAFWVEAYGGRPYTVDRVKHAGLPIIIQRLGLGLFGGIQPDRLSEILASPDDGLVSRFLWAWPNKVPARRPTRGVEIDWATRSLELLYELPLIADDEGAPRPFFCRLTDAAADLFTKWWTAHQAAEMMGPLAGPLGKAPGHVIRIALVLEHLWWCGGALAMPPKEVSENAAAAAIALVVDYFIPMAQRVYGDAAIPEADRLATPFARWILEMKPKIINAREVRRTSGLPGLRHADKVKLAIGVLVETDWLLPAPARAASGSGRQRDDYIVNPRLMSVKNA